MMKKISILTGARGQGKSTLLAEVLKNKPGVGGIITLRREGDFRDFVNLSTGESWSMQGEDGYQGPWLEIGRFRFSEEAFRRASERLVSAAQIQQVKLLVVDEIGPLELKDKGFAEILRILIATLPGPALLLVVREELVGDVLKAFEIPNAEVIMLEEFKSGNFLP
jgi:nucleoside-triphosphatase THEP1